MVGCALPEGDHAPGVGNEGLLRARIGQDRAQHGRRADQHGRQDIGGAADEHCGGVDACWMGSSLSKGTRVSPFNSGNFTPARAFVATAVGPSPFFAF